MFATETQKTPSGKRREEREGNSASPSPHSVLCALCVSVANTPRQRGVKSVAGVMARMVAARRRALASKSASEQTSFGECM